MPQVPEGPLGPISDSLTLDHLGIAINDVRAGMDHFGALLGVDRWVRTRFRTTAEYNGIRQTIGGLVAMGSLGTINIELVQPTEGSWTATDVLSTRGEGLYHVGYTTTADMSSVVAHYRDQGVAVGLKGLGDNDALLFAYLESEDLHGVTLEIISEDIRTAAGLVLDSEEYVVRRGPSPPK